MNTAGGSGITDRDVKAASCGRRGQARRSRRKEGRAMTGPAADGAYADSAAPEGRGAEEVPYEHDQAVADVAARLADLAYAAAARRWDAPDHLRAQATGLSLVPETPLVRELLLAACYDLRLDRGGKAGCNLCPRTDTEDFAWPPRIAEVPPDVVALWRGRRARGGESDAGRVQGSRCPGLSGLSRQLPGAPFAQAAHDSVRCPFRSMTASADG